MSDVENRYMRYLVGLTEEYIVNREYQSIFLDRINDSETVADLEFIAYDIDRYLNSYVICDGVTIDNDLVADRYIKV